MLMAENAQQSAGTTKNDPHAAEPPLAERYAAAITQLTQQVERLQSELAASKREVEKARVQNATEVNGLRMANQGLANDNAALKAGNNTLKAQLRQLTGLDDPTEELIRLLAQQRPATEPSTNQA